MVNILLCTFAAHGVLALLASLSILVRRRARPVSCLAWILAVFFFPALGVAAWWAFGRTRFERRLRRHQEAKRNYTSNWVREVNSGHAAFDNVIPRGAHPDNAFSSTDNKVTLLLDGAEAFEELHQVIADSQERLHLFCYEFELDDVGLRVCDALIERRRAGVVVRVLLDGFGCQATLKQIRAKLGSAGILVEVFLESRMRPFVAPRLNFVNHRKLIVADGRVGLMGGMNIASKYRFEWRDLMIRLEGPAAWGLEQVFSEDWFFATEEHLSRDRDQTPQKTEATTCAATILSSGPDSDCWIHDSYLAAIVRAEKRVVIVTPYLLPTAALLAALRVAAGRGVDVSIVTPAFSDIQIVSWASRSYHESLLKAGAELFEYQPGMLHGKALIVDDYCAVGSANIDRRSMRLNFEVTCFIESEEITRQLIEWVEDLKSSSKPVTKSDVHSKSRTDLVIESVAHLLSPVL